MNCLEDCPMPSPGGIPGNDSFTHETGVLIEGRDTVSHDEDQLQVYTEAGSTVGHWISSKHL